MVKWGLGLALIALLLPSLASAQGAAEVAARRELVERAEAARQAEDHEAALDLALRAAGIRTSASLQLFIAQEQAVTGQVVEAYAYARTCERQAELRDDLANRDALRTTCHELVEVLRARLALLTVVMPEDSAEEAAVTVNGQTVTREIWGVPYPLEPGPVVVEATAGPHGFRQELELGAGRAETVTIDFGSEAAFEIEEEEEVVESEESATEGVNTLAPDEGLSPIGLVIGGGLTAALAIGAGVTGGLALDAHAQFTDDAGRCAEGESMACDEARDARSRGTDLQLATNALWVVTGVAAAATLILLPFTDFGGDEATEVALQGRPGGAELRVRGRF